MYQQYNRHFDNRIYYNVPTLMGQGIFKVVKIENKFELEYDIDRYKVPDKIFGNLNFYIGYYWSAFMRHNYQCSLMLTGSKGAGKSECSKVLCNKALDAGLRIVAVTNVRYSPELISFLDGLEDVVLFFDEFSKIFNYQNQEKMLTLLSNVNNRRRIVIITENNINTINEFIRNRPGRLRYAKNFGKLDISVVDEYCKYNNIDMKFYEEFLTSYKKTLTFTFDHLQAIVTEHLDVPELEFKDIVDVLNLEGFTPSKVITLLNIEIKEKDCDKYKDVIIDNDKSTIKGNFTLSALEQGVRINIDIFKKSSTDDNNDESVLLETIIVSSNDIKIILEEELVFELKCFIITCKLEEEGLSDGNASLSNRGFNFGF